MNGTTITCHIGQHDRCKGAFGNCCCDCHRKEGGLPRKCPTHGNEHPAALCTEEETTMQLKYIEKPGFAAPGSGWPAADHDEPDKKVAKAKLASGFYRKAGQTPVEAATEPKTTDPSLTTQSPETPSETAQDASAGTGE